MNKDFIPYEQALELKQLGFDEPCYKYIYLGSLAINTDLYLEVEPSKAINFNDDTLSISQPTFSQCFRWFRENHDLNHFIERDGCVFNAVCQLSLVRVCNTYEEAELVCLNKLIQIVKNK